ncbi:hypothetical protein BD779DRAFT_1678249 [Infundibulicybe gibba]|nr:hypothetical protein BD779DRAFT_1678249 [Infundibulicybe gibba]
MSGYNVICYDNLWYLLLTFLISADDGCFTAIQTLLDTDFVLEYRDQQGLQQFTDILTTISTNYNPTKAPYTGVQNQRKVNPRDLISPDSRGLHNLSGQQHRVHRPSLRLHAIPMKSRRSILQVPRRRTMEVALNIILILRPSLPVLPLTDPFLSTINLSLTASVATASQITLSTSNSGPTSITNAPQAAVTTLSLEDQPRHPLVIPEERCIHLASDRFLVYYSWVGVVVFIVLQWNSYSNSP